jgi:hypothetical protein
MKPFGWMLAVLVVLAALLAVPIVARRSAPPDCAGRVVIVTGPDRQPLECVCVNGALSTCFNPGP